MTKPIVPFPQGRGLISTVAAQWLDGISIELASRVVVVEVGTDEVSSAEFARSMEIPVERATATLVVECERAGQRWVGVVVAPGGRRLDLNAKVRKAFGARSVRLLEAVDPLSNRVLEQEKGSVGPIGLPTGTSLVVHETLLEEPFIYAGSGLLRSKLGFPPHILLEYERVVVTDVLRQIR